MATKEFLEGFIAAYRPKFIDPKFVVRHNSGVELEGLEDYLDSEVEAGKLKKVVRIADPDGTLIAGPYDSIEDIPDTTFPNRFSSFYYELDDCEIIHGYDRVKVKA